MLNEERNRIHAEFVTFLGIVGSSRKAMCDLSYIQTELWCLLATTDGYYQNCKNFIDFALNFLKRTFNETESKVYSMEDIETRKHDLNHENAAEMNLISTNRPILS